MWKLLSLSTASLSLATLLPPPGAQAGEKLGGSCQISGIHIAAAPIGDIAKAPPISFPVTLTCTVDRNLESKWLSQGYRVGYCWHIHNNPTSFDYRTVSSWHSPNTGQTINFNFYAPNGALIGGGGEYSGNKANVLGFAEGGNGVYHATDTITLRFENNSPDLPPGKYDYYSLTQFHGGMTAVRPGEAPSPYYPHAFCQSYIGNHAGNEISGPKFYTPQITARPKVTVAVKTFCNIRQPYNVSFGKYAALKKVKPAYVSVNVSCSAGIHYRVAVNNGRHAANGWRYMTLNNTAVPAGGKIAYSVSPASWEGVGDGAPGGTAQRLMLSVPNQDSPPKGIYRDTLVLTLERLAEAGNI